MTADRVFDRLVRYDDRSTDYPAKRDAIWTPNSWAGHGQGWITRADLTSLLAENGEAVIPLGRRTPKRQQ